jgi:murein DD-endopeptidase MepM/ murein hydrolase activator NlpD
MPTIADPTMSIATPGAAPIGVPNFFIDKFRIPPFLLSLYQAAGVEYGVRWEVLAAINEMETDYGRNLNVSSAGAVGWMQFLPSTWKQYGVDANGDGRKDPYNPLDAIFSAARYLRAAGAEKDLRRAIFAYNHADWYVDAVLMRARLIGGLPSNLVGSLTGLTQGVFPVGARARYADDLDEREGRRRVAKGRNAALPVESSPTRRGINIYAKPGSPVVAVQDGKIVKIGQTERLGRFIQLRDPFGNTYTYAHLGKLAKRHPVPKDAGAPSTAITEPPRDPAPTGPASAGKQRRRATSTATRKERVARVAVKKERAFAHPRRKASWKAGGRSQVLEVATAADLKLLDLPADQVEMRHLKVGSKVIGGTVLGKIGRTDMVTAPHVLFEIRPAGRGAPRIDPKPILDGWKLLESSALYRAKGKNPFFGRDAKAPTIGQILLMRKSELETRVLRNPRIEVYGGGRRDIRGRRIDRRVLATLEFLAASGLRPTVTSLESGHSLFTASGNVSHHASGNAVDIAKINGVPVLGHQGEGSITDIAVRRLLTLQGTMQPSQIITLMKYEDAPNTYAMGDHADHIHVGFTPMYGTNSKLGRQLNATLRPGQWIKLVDRLGEIDNPTVRVTPSKAALVVKPRRASARHRGE